MRRLIAITLVLASSLVGSAAAADDPPFLTIPCQPASGSASAQVTYDEDADNVELDGTVLVSPPSFEFPVVVEPNASYDCTLTIRNRRPERTTFQLAALGVLGSKAPNAGYEFVDESDDRWDATAGSWIEPGVDEVTIDPRGVAQVPFRIVVPAEPPAGSAYGSINVVSRTQARAGETAIGIELQVASIVLLPTSDDGEPDLRLHDIEAPKLRWEREAWPLTAKLDNDGTLFAATEGRIRIRSIFGNEVASLPIQAQTILPGGREAVDEEWDRVPWLGFYRWDARVEDETDLSIAVAEGWFVALPPWWVLAIVGAVVLILLVRWMRRRANEWGEDDEAPDDDEFDFDEAERQLRE